MKQIKAGISSLLATALAITLTACGGGGGGSGSKPPVEVPKKELVYAMVQPSDFIVPSEGYKYNIQPLTEPDVATSVLEQSKLPGEVILWAGVTRHVGFDKFPAFISQAIKYQNIKLAYLYDELFWSGTSIDIGLHEHAVVQAAILSKANNLKTVVVIMPDVILDPGFKFADSRLYSSLLDIIGIDVYPSIRIRPNSQVGDCRFEQHVDKVTGVSNPYSDLFYCSLLKLRKQGYNGEVWLLNQGFGIAGEDQVLFRANLDLQARTMKDAALMGAAGVAPWGVYLGKDALEGEDFLRPLGGTDLEHFVVPDFKNK